MVSDCDSEAQRRRLYAVQAASDHGVQEQFEQMRRLGIYALAVAIAGDPMVRRYLEQRACPVVIDSEMQAQAAASPRGGWSAMLVLLVIAPAVLFWDLLRRGCSRCVQAEADVFLPVMAGLADADGLVAGRKRFDDAHVLGGELTAARVMFHWTPHYLTDPQVRRQQSERFAAHGYRLCDPARFPVSGPYAQAVWRITRHLLHALWQRPEARQAPRWMWRALWTLAYTTAKEWQFQGAIRAKVLLEAQDYAPRHIVRTLVANQCEVAA